MTSRRTDCGFSLVEMLVAVAISVTTFALLFHAAARANAWLAHNPKRRMPSSVFVWRPRCCGGTCSGRAPVRLTVRMPARSIGTSHRSFPRERAPETQTPS